MVAAVLLLWTGASSSASLPMKRLRIRVDRNRPCTRGLMRLQGLQVTYQFVAPFG
jgi:hypothetical protein